MPVWQLAFTKLQEMGRAYALESATPDAPGAFAVRLEAEVPGAISFPPGLGGGFVVAFGNACTHMGCLLVSRETEMGDLLAGPCPCHGTIFDLARAGLVVQGPATQHLPQLRLSASPNGQSLVGDGWLREDDPRAESWPLPGTGDADGRRP